MTSHAWWTNILRSYDKKQSKRWNFSRNWNSKYILFQILCILKYNNDYCTSEIDLHYIRYNMYCTYEMEYLVTYHCLLPKNIF